MPEAPTISVREPCLPVTLPDTSLAIPRDTERRDLFPIRKPKQSKPAPRRPSLATRRRRRLTEGF